jgi:hypothetical protein
MYSVEFEKTRADDYRPGCLYLISCWYPRFQVQKRFTDFTPFNQANLQNPLN